MCTREARSETEGRLALGVMGTWTLSNRRSGSCVCPYSTTKPAFLKGLTHVPGKEVRGMALFSYQ